MSKHTQGTHELIDRAIHLRAHTHEREAMECMHDPLSLTSTPPSSAPHTLSTLNTHTLAWGTSLPGTLPRVRCLAGTISACATTNRGCSRFTPTLTVVSCHDAIRTLHAVPQRQSQPIGSAGALNELKYSHCMSAVYTEDRLASSVV